MDKMIRKILIANRGEIAVRVIRTAKRMGINTVAVYSNEDKNSFHVKMADEAVCIGEVELAETYLNTAKIISSALNTGADAIHPGYGFLSENPLFVEACNNAGIIFIGPGSEVMNTMGNKIAAREFVSKTGVPIVKGVSGSKEELLSSAGSLEYPVLVKAAAGGGGKGMKIVNNHEDLEDAINSASRQAKAYFGDETIYLEKYIEKPRHIEIQILGDHYGNVIHLFERECSIQRRYQKIIEESPSPTLNDEIRHKMGNAAVKIGQETGYTGAGTIEFLVDENLNYYFLEMNTRIQVEHPVTELVTGIDIVEEQITIAEGKSLRFRQEDIRQRGHAIECRIYAEDPENDFRPSPGTMTFYRAPQIADIRIDSAIDEASTISPAYDPMIAKLITWGNNRDEAASKMLYALSEYVIHGIKTNIEFLSRIMENEAYLKNDISTKFCDTHLENLNSETEKKRKSVDINIPLSAFVMHEMMPGNFSDNVWKLIGFWRNLIQPAVVIDEKTYKLVIKKKNQNIAEVRVDEHILLLKLLKSNAGFLYFLINGTSHSAYISEMGNGTCQISTKGLNFEIKRTNYLPELRKSMISESDEAHTGEIHSPMPGKVIRINVSEGDEVEKGKVLMILEAMKMENTILAPGKALVKKIYVSLNDRIESNVSLIDLQKIQ